MADFGFNFGFLGLPSPAESRSIGANTGNSQTVDVNECAYESHGDLMSSSSRSS
jgi:hypothetical protein